MSSTPPYNNSVEEPEEGEQYGTVVALTAEGDLKQNEIYEFAEINDVKAVVQDLKVALLTPQGADPMRPEYGLDILRRSQESPDDPSAIGTSDAEFRVAVHEAIGPRADPRVLSIDQIEINRTEGDRSQVEVFVTITLADGPQTRFSFSPNILESS